MGNAGPDRPRKLVPLSMKLSLYAVPFTFAETEGCPVAPIGLIAMTVADPRALFERVPIPKTITPVVGPGLVTPALEIAGSCMIVPLLSAVVAGAMAGNMTTGFCTTCVGSAWVVMSVQVVGVAQL